MTTELVGLYAPPGVHPDPVPNICAIVHPGFAALPGPVFRRADGDGAPVVVTRLGQVDAAIPLPALRGHLGIADTSADARMLGLIAEALDYVVALRPGDTLPAEIRTGEASWEVEPAHLLRAITRLRLCLVAWLRGVPARLDGPGVSDAEIDRQIHAASQRAARELGLPSGAAVADLIEAMARELAFIEALRERLHARLTAMSETMETATRGWRGDPYHIEMLVQVRRLLGTALARIGERFAQLDAQSAAIIPFLRGTQEQRSLIRFNRDWLYRSQRAFEPVLEEWDGAPAEIDPRFWRRVGAAYRFLSPRFMACREWPRPRRVVQKPAPALAR